MISIPMSKCQFEMSAEAVTNDHAEATVEKTGDLTGHIHTSQIDADYEYKDVDGGYLVLNNEKKHGLYNMVSDDTIGTHLNNLLGGLKCKEMEPEAATISTDSSELAGSTGTETKSFVKPIVTTQTAPIVNTENSNTSSTPSA